jgi:RimJ/RimL family protein N-acetyltransferase
MDFQTPRLRLRPLCEADAALYGALYTDPGVMANLGPPLDADRAQRGFLAALRRGRDPARGERRWSVAWRADGTPAGLLAAIPTPGRRGTCVELGVMLLPPSQGRGLAHELYAAVLPRVFAPDAPPVARAWSRHAPGHLAAAGVLRVAGFRPGPPLDGFATGLMTPARWARLRDDTRQARA